MPNSSPRRILSEGDKIEVARECEELFLYDFDRVKDFVFYFRKSNFSNALLHERKR
jgi:hypothetical protein